MKKTLLKIITLIMLCCLAVGCLGVGSAFASTTVSQEYSDEFGGSSLSGKWTNNGAKLHTEYNAMRIQNFNIWGPSINLIQYEVAKNSSVTFDMVFTSGEWVGVAFGLDKQTDTLPKANCAVIMYGGATDMIVRGTGGELSASTMDSFADLPTVIAAKNRQITVKLDIDADGVIYVSSALKGEPLQRKGSYEGCFKEGYMGFAAMSAPPSGTYADITSFKLETNGNVVYSTDFTEDTISYNSSGFDSSATWYVSSRYGENNAKIEPVNSVEISDGEFISYNSEIVSNEVSETIFEATFDAAIQSLEEGAFFGVGLGRSSASAALTENSFIGFGKMGDTYYLASVINGSLFEIKGSYHAQVIGVGAAKIKLNFKGLYGNRVEVSFGAESAEFTNVDYNGFLAIGCYAEKSDAAANVLIDDFAIDKATHNISYNDDVSIDFKGVKSWVENGEQLTEYYINKHLFYLGSGVTVPNYRPNQERHYLNFVNTNVSSVFAPKRDYGDFVLRFSFYIPEGYGASSSPNARIGFALGMKSIYYTPSESSFFCFQKGNKNATMAVGRNMADEYGLTGAYYDTEYDVWSNTPETYNVMAVVEDGKVKVYYKKDSEPESKMNILRHTFTAENTYGYVGVFGYDGATFRLTEFSITNLAPEKYDGVIDGKVGNSSLKANGTLKNGETLTATNGLDSYAAFTRLKTDGAAGVTLKLGGKTLSLTNAGLIYDADEIELITNEFNAKALKSSMLIRASVIGDSFEIGVRYDGSESQLYVPVITGKLKDKQANAAVSVTADGGNISVNSFKVISLQSDIELRTHDYDKAYEDSFASVGIKPAKGGDSSGCSSSVGGSDVAVFALLAGALFVVARRKKCQK